MIIHPAYLITGSNRGNRLFMLKKAKQLISERCGEVVRWSGVYQSPSWGFVDNTAFLNQVLLVNTTLDPTRLLACILQIESEMGRTRRRKGYSSRKIDIDILFFGDCIIDENNLKIPHPHIPKRRFVLTPLAEIATEFIHPQFRVTINQLLGACDDDSVVLPYNEKIQNTNSPA